MICFKNIIEDINNTKIGNITVKCLFERKNKKKLRYDKTLKGIYKRNPMLRQIIEDAYNSIDGTMIVNSVIAPPIDSLAFIRYAYDNGGLDPQKFIAIELTIQLIDDAINANDKLALKSWLKI